MTDTFEWECTDCDEPIYNNNPQRCPQCGHTILRPVETVESPNTEQSEKTTEGMNEAKQTNDECSPSIISRILSFFKQ